MAKKILILGGSAFQIPAIKYARSAGYHVVTCDFLPGNPGHQLSDEYHNVSTTDLDGVLQLGRQLKIDGILAYASDPAAPTAAFVGEKLGLAGNPYECVRIMANKDQYRSFLSLNGFNAPKAVSGITSNSPLSAISDLNFPLMVKPVDSSGSKGVLKIETDQELFPAVEYAASFSRTKRVVVEEFLQRKGPQIGGEAFVLKGELVFMCLGDQFVDSACNPFVPAGMTFPSQLESELVEKIAHELQRLLKKLRFSTGGLNLEIMLNDDEQIFLMEVGPRTGGNFLPELMHYASGFNLAAAAVETALGHSISGILPAVAITMPRSAFAYYAIHSSHNGILKSLQIDPVLREFILEMHQFVQVGGAVQAYNGSNCTIGILLLKFSDPAVMKKIFPVIDRYLVMEISPFPTVPVISADSLSS